MADPLIRMEHVTKSFDGVVAVDDASLTLEVGVNAVIGPNGAGKTTLFNILTGFEQGYTGEVHALGRRTTGWRPHPIARLGLVRTFQHPMLFTSMTTFENVRVGRHLVTRFRPVAEALGITQLWASRAERDRCEELLELVGLGGRGQQSAGLLPYGDQRRLEIARALAAEPSVLLLDEPAAGLNAQEVDRLGVVLRDVAGTGVAVVLIEHNVPFVMSLAQRVIVLDQGRVIASGSPGEVSRNEDVLSAYLGTKRAASELAERESPC